jgi:cell wall-associated NlpC family hydrolase
VSRTPKYLIAPTQRIYTNPLLSPDTAEAYTKTRNMEAAPAPVAPVTENANTAVAAPVAAPAFNEQAALDAVNAEFAKTQAATDSKYAGYTSPSDNSGGYDPENSGGGTGGGGGGGADDSTGSGINISDIISTGARKIVDIAKKYLGMNRYVYGGWDCSKFTQKVATQAGQKGFPRDTGSQLAWFKAKRLLVSRKDMKVGDFIIVYSAASDSKRHTGIYIGNGKWIDNSGSGRPIAVRSIAGKQILGIGRLPIANEKPKPAPIVSPPTTAVTSAQQMVDAEIPNEPILSDNQIVDLYKRSDNLPTFISLLTDGKPQTPNSRAVANYKNGTLNDSGLTQAFETLESMGLDLNNIDKLVPNMPDLGGALAGVGNGVGKAFQNALHNTTWFKKAEEELAKSPVPRDYHGTIDFSKRLTPKNRDGTYSTPKVMVLSMPTSRFPNRTILIPTVAADGHQMSAQEAEMVYRTTDQHLGVFNSPREASLFGKRLEEQQVRFNGRRMVQDMADRKKRLARNKAANKPKHKTVYTSAATARNVHVSGSRYSTGRSSTVNDADRARYGLR